MRAMSLRQLTELGASLAMPNVSVSLPAPLTYEPDMSNNSSAQNWISAGAQKISYLKEDSSGKIIDYAILYLGFTYADNKSLPMFVYADWLSNRYPKCGDTLQSHVRPIRSDDEFLKDTDYLLGNYLAGYECLDWRDGGESDFCIFEGNGKNWLPVDCGVTRHAAFLKISDSQENYDKTTPNLQFKTSWDLLRPPIPNGNRSIVDFADQYDSNSKTLAVRQHYSLGRNSRCGKFGFSITPPAEFSDTLDHSAWEWYYFGLQNLTYQTVNADEFDKKIPFPIIAIPILASLGALKLRQKRFAEKGIQVDEKYGRKARR